MPHLHNSPLYLLLYIKYNKIYVYVLIYTYLFVYLFACCPSPLNRIYILQGMFVSFLPVPPERS